MNFNLFKSKKSTHEVKKRYTMGTYMVKFHSEFPIENFQKSPSTKGDYYQWKISGGKLIDNPDEGLLWFGKFPLYIKGKPKKESYYKFHHNVSIAERKGERFKNPYGVLIPIEDDKKIKKYNSIGLKYLFWKQIEFDKNHIRFFPKEQNVIWKKMFIIRNSEKTWGVNAILALISPSESQKVHFISKEKETK